MPERISRTLIKQRIRNRIVEYFDLTVEDIAKFGTFEIINQWQDCFGDKWDPEFYSQPVFSPHEQNILRKFNEFWNNIADETREELYDVSENSTWIEFVDICEKNKKEFMKRGRFSEEVEEFNI